MATKTTKAAVAAEAAKVIKDEPFHERFVRIREAAGYSTPSEVAKAIWGEKEDARGLMLANNRDTIWRYENGKGMPSRKNFKLLAKALGLTEDQLDPTYTPTPRGKKARADVFELKVLSPVEDDYMRLVTDLRLPRELALSVLDQINVWWKANRRGATAATKNAKTPTSESKAIIRKTFAKKAPAKKGKK